MSKDSEKGRYTSPEGSALWEYIAAASCFFVTFCLGFVAGWNSPTLAILMKPNSSITLTSSEASTMTSAAAAGHAVAPTLIILMADKLGRKNSILVGGIPMIINWGLMAVSQHVMVLTAARFIGGLSLGLIFCVPLMYLGEIATVKLRGAIGTICGTTFNIGMLFMFLVVPYLSVQAMARVCLIITGIALISVWFIPESPYFLAMVGKLDEAEGALEKLRGKTDVSEELELIKMTVDRSGKDPEDRKEGDEQETDKASSSFKKLFTDRGNRKALFICMLLTAVQQVGGGICIMVYGEIMFTKMKTGISAHACMLIISVIQIGANILTTFVIDRIGRRPLLCISGITSSVCLLTVAVYYYLMDYTKIDVTPYWVIGVGAIIANTLALSIGTMPIQMVIQSEIFGSDVKAMANTITGISSGMVGTISMKLYLTLAETWGLGHSVPFFGFVIVTSCCTGTVLKLLPETKGKTLFEIQKDLKA